MIALLAAFLFVIAPGPSATTTTAGAATAPVGDVEPLCI
jgi:hypothetical protein